MIKINLATRKQTGVSSDTRLGSFNLGSLSKVDLDRFKGLPIKKVAVPIVAGLVASFALDFVREGELKKLEAASAKLTSEGAVLQTEINKLKSYEPIKKVLDEDEVTIKTKLETIHKLITGRGIPVKILLNLSNAIPKNVWLKSVEVSSSEISLRGNSLDFNQISDFMKSLNENAFYSDVSLKNSQTGKDEGGLDIATFELKVKRR